jgi:hypothetical protein
MFNERKIIKQYLAITKFKPEINEGEINIPLIEREVDGITKVNIEKLVFFNKNSIFFYFKRYIYRQTTTKRPV